MTVIFDYCRAVSHDDETLAERFSRLTEEAGLHPAEVARIMGLGEGMVYKIKRGDVKTPGLIGMLRLAKRLNVSPYYLACEPEPSDAPAVRISQLEANVNHLGIRDKLRGPLPGEEPASSPGRNPRRSALTADEAVDLVTTRLKQQNSAIAKVLRAAFRVLDLHDPTVEEALRGLEAPPQAR